MSGYLLDTNVISLLAPKSSEAKPGALRVAEFRAWVREHDERLFLSTVTLAEIQAGISRLERKRASRRAADLAHWLDAILELYDSRTLPLTSVVALEAGRLLDHAIGLGADPGFEDAAIAATAVVHGLMIVTANTRHFDTFGVTSIPPPS
jgi:predicted nucleic acid-binding protein